MTATETFETPQARKIWQKFLRDLDWGNRTLAADESRDARAEAYTHIHEAMRAVTDGTEADRLSTAIQGYGDLPKAPPVWKKPLGITLHYGSILLIGIVGVFLLGLLVMATLEVFNPDEVGLWVYTSGDWSISHQAQPQATEVLGAWFIPAVLATIIVTGAMLYGLWRLAIAPTGRVTDWMNE